MEKLKVKAKSVPCKVAGAIANIYREDGQVLIETVGAGSLNQAIKAITIARGYVAPSGSDLVVIPSFSEVTINDMKKTAIRLVVTNR